MTFVSFLVLALATWRLSSILVNEEGPFDVFLSIRHLVGVKYGPRSEQYGDHVVSKLFACVWCMSVWVGILLTVLYLLFGDVAIYLSVPFALSSIAILFEALLGQT